MAEVPCTGRFWSGRSRMYSLRPISQSDPLFLNFSPTRTYSPRKPTFLLFFSFRELTEWQGPLQTEKRGELTKKLDQIIAETTQIYSSNESVLLWQLLKLMITHDGVSRQGFPLAHFLLLLFQGFSTFREKNF